MNHEDLINELRKNPEYVQAEHKLRFQIELANAVLYARTDKGWSQTELARRVQTRQANISHIESAIANPTLDLIRRLCDALDLNLTFSKINRSQESSTSNFFYGPETDIRIDHQDDNVFCGNYRTGKPASAQSASIETMGGSN
jgi:ribosome-binding protein aMBF1 (putative translation factor)